MVVIRSDSSLDLFLSNSRITTMTTLITVVILNIKTRNNGIEYLHYLSPNNPDKALLIARRMSSASVAPCPSAVQEQTISCVSAETN